jgi:phage N-6-adenine-methyltransferase
MDDVLFSSDNTLWETPPEIFNPLNEKYQFTLDVCAEDSTAKCNSYLTERENGLIVPWGANNCWMNPPYGRGLIEPWIEKAFKESLLDAFVCALLPARTSNAWFHDYVYGYADIVFIKGRIRFLENGKRKSSAPFPSMFVYWGRNNFRISSPAVIDTIQLNKEREILL